MEIPSQLLVLLGCQLLQYCFGQQCTPELPSLDTIRSEAIFIGNIVNRPIQQNLIPDIGFTCSGELTSWTIVATTVSGGTRYPELQIWRSNGGNDYTKIGSTEIDESSRVTENVYEYRPNPPIQIQNGDVLGIYSPAIPRLKFGYQESGGPTNYYIGGPISSYSQFSLDSGLVITSHNDVPLVAVEVSNPGCLTGFIDLNTLMIKASILSNNRSDITYREATQRIVPELAFSCNGIIHSFMLAALDRGRVSTRVSYPEIQLWRRVNDNEWIKITGIGVDAAIERTEYLNVHMYTSVPPIEVQIGDIIGVYQPYNSVSILQLYLQEDGPENHYRRDVQLPLDSLNLDNTLVYEERRLPLITVEFSKKNSYGSEIPTSHTTSTTPSTTTSTQVHTLSPAVHSTSASQPTPSSSVAPTPTHSTSASQPVMPTPSSSVAPTAASTPQNGLIVAIVICTLLVILAVVGVSVLVVKMYRARIWRSILPNAVQAPVAAANIQDSLDYNAIYRPQNPADIICDGKRHRLDLKENGAYSTEVFDTPGATAARLGAQNRETPEHIYESID